LPTVLKWQKENLPAASFATLVLLSLDSLDRRQNLSLNSTTASPLSAFIQQSSNAHRETGDLVMTVCVSSSLPGPDETK
jgi:hypothetical protein